MMEIAAGTMVGPFVSLSDIPVEEPAVTIRRGIWEQHGDAEHPTVRNIDDLLFGEHNGTVAIVSSTRGGDLLEPRLLGLMESQGVSPEHMDKLGEAVVTTLAIINCVAVDGQSFIDFIEKPPLDIKNTIVVETISQAKVVAVYEAAKMSRQVELKAATSKGLAATVAGGGP